MSFFEVEFPKKLGFFGSTGGLMGGPGWSTIVNKGFSGFEQRNRNWQFTRHKYQLDLVSRPISEYLAVLNFFLVVGGMADAFRFLDQVDFQATGVPTSPAQGNGNNKIFQLQQQYSIGSGATARTYLRAINKPIMSVLQQGGSPLTDFQGNQLANTVNVYLNGVLKVLNTDYTVDATTGLISFVVAPGSGVNVTADCQFHTPVRFDSDDWPAQVDPSNIAGGSGLVSVTGINLVEVLIEPGQSQG